MKKSVLYGITATVLLFVIFLIAVGLISDLPFLKDQLSKYWYYIIALTSGFGIQFGLYTRLKQVVRGHHGREVVAVSGSTSTVAMVSCCAHYLTNILPILGATGIAAIASQYQIKFFWVGIVFNLFGILFIAHKLKKTKRA